MRYLIISILVLAGLVPSLANSQTVAVELEKMNILYVGVENPIRIAVENFPCDQIVVKSTYGTIMQTHDKCHYLYKTDSCALGREIILVGIKLKEKIKWLDTLEYRVRRAPNPRILIAGHWSGIIKKESFINSKIVARHVDINVDDAATIISYSYEVRRNDTIICRETDIQGNSFTETMKSEIRKSRTGDKYFFFDIIAIVSIDKCIWQLESTEFEIE